MPLQFVRVSQGGRMILPAKVRASLGVKVGSNVAVEVHGDRAILTSAQVLRRKARQRVMKAIPKNVSLVDELLAERRQEASRE